MISEHFNRSDFACHCGCGFDTVDVELIRILEEVWDFVGGIKRINSGCRCAEYNKRVGGVPKSQHVVGRAADIPLDDPEAVYNYLNEKYPKSLGLGLYHTFLHVDTRTNGPARWDIR